MNMISNYKTPDEEWEDPANQDDFPETDDLDLQDDDNDIDINNNDSDEIPNGDDVDLDRAE